MDFELNEEQTLLRDGLRELLDRACDLRTLRTVALDGDATSPALWQALAESGWTALAVPEELGGLGLDFEAIAIVAIECGRSLLPLPLMTTILASRAIGRSPGAAAQASLLAAIAEGKTSATLALAAAIPGSPGLTARRTADGWRLDGSLPLVGYGPLAGVVLADATIEGGSSGLFVIPAAAAGVTWTAIDYADRTVRRFDLGANGVALPAEAALYGTTGASDGVARLAEEWTVVLAAESSGASERAIEIAAAYVKERVQFGRPVGSNQAVKVRLAEMHWSAEQLRVAVYNAAMCIEQDLPERASAVPLAKAAASAPGAWIGTQAIHVHGGIGFTWEADVHMFFKRLKSNELLFGNSTTSYRRLADVVLDPAFSMFEHAPA